MTLWEAGTLEAKGPEWIWSHHFFGKQMNRAGEDIVMSTFTGSFRTSVQLKYHFWRDCNMVWAYACKVKWKIERVAVFIPHIICSLVSCLSWQQTILWRDNQNNRWCVNNPICIFKKPKPFPLQSHFCSCHMRIIHIYMETRESNPPKYFQVQLSLPGPCTWSHCISLLELFVIDSSL